MARARRAIANASLHLIVLRIEESRRYSLWYFMSSEPCSTGK
jgi:hypothetical protein